MKKLVLRLFAVFLILLLPLSAISCGNGGNADTAEPSDTITTEKKEMNITTEKTTANDTEKTTEKPHHDVIYAESVVVDLSGAKTEFEYNENFTSEGVRLVAIMTDGEERELSLDYCDFYAPTLNAAGEYTVEVDYYGGEVLDHDGNDLEILLTYTVTVKERTFPVIGSRSLASITGAGSYRVEAEQIDLEATGVQAQSGGELIISDGLVSGGQFIANYGVVGNVFGFTFTSDKEYTDAKIILRMANFQLTMIYPYENLAVYLKNANDSDMSQLPLDPSLWLFTRAPAVGGTEEGDFTLVWSDVVLEGVTIKEGENTLLFDIIGKNSPYFDYIEIQVGS